MKRFFFLFLLFIPIIIFSQGNNGPISGEIRDAITKQPLSGTNVFISGTSFGSNCDDKGYYPIKNIVPGKYSVKATIIGYESSTNLDVVVSPLRNKKNLVRVEVSGGITTNPKYDFGIMPIAGITAKF
jgi:hypothetical protein